MAAAGQQTADFTAWYALRAGIEGTLATAAHGCAVLLVIA
jgi:hypothetical protein